MKKFLFLLVVAVVAVAGFFIYRNKSQAQRFEDTTHSTIEQTEHGITNAFKAGTRKANELKTNVATKVKAGMQQANKVAANAFSQVKEATTNAFHQVKKTIGDSSR